MNKFKYALIFVEGTLFRGVTNTLQSSITLKDLLEIQEQLQPNADSFKFINYVLATLTPEQREQSGYVLNKEHLIYLASKFDTGYNKPDDRNEPEPYDNIKPDHYKAGGMDVIAFTAHHELGFNAGNVIKYVTRAGKKPETPALIDLQKAREYLDRLIEIEERAAQ